MLVAQISRAVTTSLPVPSLLGRRDLVLFCSGPGLGAGGGVGVGVDGSSTVRYDKGALQPCLA